MSNVASLPVYVRIQVMTCGMKIDPNTPTACQVSYWLLRTCPFILVLIGTIGNLLNLVVLSRPLMRKQSTGMFLMGLACSDTVILWNGQIRSTLIHGWGTDIRDASAFTCATQESTMFFCGHFSVWTMATISLERMLLTKFPVAAKAIITKRKAAILIISLIIISALLTLHVPFGKSIQTVTEHSGNNETEHALVSKCTLIVGPYLHFYRTEWNLIKIFTFSIVPLIVIFCCNAVIIWTLLMQRQRVRPTDTNVSSEASASNDRSKALTRMIVLISVYYMITSTPFNIFTYYVGILPNDYPESEMPNLFLVYLIIIYVGTTNFAFNFFFYFGSGPMFKRELNKIWINVTKRVQRMRDVTAVEPATNTTRS